MDEDKLVSSLEIRNTNITAFWRPQALICEILHDQLNGPIIIAMKSNQT